MAILKEKLMSLFFIDSKSKAEEKRDEMLKTIKSELLTFVEHQITRATMKGDTEFITLELTIKEKGGGMEKMNRFFRGAVVPYYFRQHHDFWREKLPSKEVLETTNDLKRAVGFTLYDSEGRKTTNPNSITTFKKIAEFNEFLEHVENVCFQDNDYIFPSSEHFNELSTSIGLKAAQHQVMQELFEKTRNKYQDRDIPIYE